MGKLGKKARKFAKKNLQSVMKKKRQFRSMINRKTSKKGERNHPEEEEREKIVPSKERNIEDQDILDIPLEDIFGEEGSDEEADDSDSDGYLSEESDACAKGDENGIHQEDNSSVTAYSAQNKDIHSELVKKKKMLEKLKKKDPEFSRFLDNYKQSLNQFREDDSFSDDVSNNDGMEALEEDSSKTRKIKLLTASTIDVWCQQVIDEQSLPALTSLLNAYRVASHYGTESTRFSHDTLSYEIPNSECFSRILVFMLREANMILRGLLVISCSSCKKESVLDLKNTQKWKTLKPLVKSYLRSTLFMLGQITDSGILDFALKQLKDAIIFFAAFPSLLHRLVKVTVHLWATGKGTISSHSFLIIRAVTSTFGSDWLDTCLIKMYKTFAGHCKFVEPGLLKHMEYLRNSIVELCSLDVHKSSGKAMVSVNHLAKILQLAMKAKKKEALKKVCSWQYTNCIDLWVTFASKNISEYDLQQLLFMIVQIINGMAWLFPGPRYLPLRIKCIQWLNNLSHSSGIFIPVASFALDVLEYKVGKAGGKPAKDFNFSSSVKLPKYWLKSQDFHEQCVFSAIELLCVHFDQWSHHISFPELATAPLIRLRKFCETTTAESFKRAVKRCIDQVQALAKPFIIASFTLGWIQKVGQNVDFVRKKRDEVAFSPKDQQAVETFLQLERSNGNASFRQYYRRTIQKAVSNSLLTMKKSSSMEKKKPPRKRRQPQNGSNVAAINGEGERQKNGKTRKKRKT